jgi:glycosyltransferase involved in cell wall biosynthesis
VDFSVVIPARNEEAYLPGALEALAAQRLTPYEVVVVDNGSTDRTAEIARAWGARLIACPEPGVARARQRGLEAARGSWVATTDADSRPSPGWLEALSRRAEGAIALYGPLRFYGVSPLEAWFSEWGYRLFLRGMSLLGQPNLAGANMAFRREVALQLGGYPLVPAREDVLLGLALARQGPVRYVSEALVLTSARRLKNGWVPFLLQQLRSLRGKTEGYFPEDGERGS